jgi:HK97 family phage major capsid protein
MSLEDQMREKRAARKAELDALLSGAESRSDSNLTEDENLKFDALVAEIRKDDERIVELAELAKREAAADETRRMVGGAIAPATVTDPPVYVSNGRNGQSYFRDLGQLKLRGDADAQDRLIRASRQAADEQRALGNTNAAGGSGGEFAPPAWLINEWVNIIRLGRVTPDLFRKMDIPDGISSINIPKITGGTTVALQTSQNSALSQTDMTTSYVQTGWATVGGKQVISQQLLDQAAVNFDQLILNDLAADYARQVGALTFSGTGTGTGTNAVVNGLTLATYGSTTTWTQASPTAPLFYAQAAKTIAAFIAARQTAPTCWVMHPRRWFWLVSSLDSQNRPLVVPNGPAMNQIAEHGGVVMANGLVGTMHGLPVYIDPAVPITSGAGTEDWVYLLKQDDLILLEGTPKTEAFRETYADSVGVLFRLYNYVGTILNRHSESLGLLKGTGMIAPVFAG